MAKRKKEAAIPGKGVVSGIYWIRHIESDKRYIGSAGDIYKRWSVHLTTLKQGKHHCHHLQRSWKKYGGLSAFEFKVIHVCSLDALQSKEQKYMNRYKGKLFNIHPLARTARGFKLSEQHKRVLSAVQKIIGADPEERKRRSVRAKMQHAEGRIGHRKFVIHKRVCANCSKTFDVDRPYGRPTGSKYCKKCRLKIPHYGGRYDYDRSNRPTLMKVFCKGCGKEVKRYKLNSGVWSKSNYCSKCRHNLNVSLGKATGILKRKYRK